MSIPLADSVQTHTAVDRSRRRDESRLIPAVFIAGSAGTGSPPAQDRVIAFERLLSIGRRAQEMTEADGYWVVRDDLVSRLHCRISKNPEGWEIEDLGSRNGTAVDGSMLKAATPAKLKEGAVICLGNHVAVFRVITDSELEAVRRELHAPFGPVASASPDLALLSGKLT